jgi:hypothetical protein
MQRTILVIVNKEDSKKEKDQLTHELFFDMFLYLLISEESIE